MALSFVQHPTNNLSIHHSLFNKSYSTTSSSLKLHSSSASAARLCSGLRTSFGLAPPPLCSILRSTRQYRRYSKVSSSDDDAADDDFFTFEKFTEKAIDVVSIAKDEAKRSGYDLFGAEHVLLAIISEGTSVAADFLTESMRIENVQEAREAVKTCTERGSRFDANRVFKLSIDNARELGHDYVDVDHILLGLIPEDESNGTVVLDILKNSGVDPTSIRKQLLERMDEQKMVMLKKYGTNLTKQGVQAGFVAGHTKDVVEQVINNLCTFNPTRRNPCLIGKSRVVSTEI
ncbi:hypothetical protein MKW92_010851, partial [Papaver armeniacum]